MRIQVFTVGLLLAGAASKAEYRAWEATSGSTVEAEMVSAKNGKVQLRRRDGKVVTVPISTFSIQDQQYITENVPPQLHIELEVDSKKIKSEHACSARNNGGELSVTLKSTVCRAAFQKRGAVEGLGCYSIKMICVGQNMLTHELQILQEKTLEIADLAKAGRKFEMESNTMELIDVDEDDRYLFARRDDCPIRLAGFLVVVYNAKGKALLISESEKGLEDRVKTEISALDPMRDQLPLPEATAWVTVGKTAWQDRYAHNNQTAAVDSRRTPRWKSLDHDTVLALVLSYYGNSLLAHPAVLSGDFRIFCEMEVLLGNNHFGVIHADGSEGKNLIDLQAEPGDRFTLEISRTDGRLQYLLNGKKAAPINSNYNPHRDKDLLFIIENWKGGAVRFQRLEISKG